MSVARLAARVAAWLLVAAVAGAGGSACHRQRSVDDARGSSNRTWAFGGPLPGAPAFDDQLAGRLQAAWTARSPRYQPRTRHRLGDGSPAFTNRLFLESSPYLRQHAHNPVNWYPWSDEAFQTALRLERPVLLSVGYSTCHWCHVMEEESFEDEAIARYLNENYVAIKVDREERPDIDAIYMSALQALTGHGGWPMTMWLTPERQPFYGGSYFPPNAFLTGLKELKGAFQRQPDRVVASAAELTRAIARRLGGGPPADLPGAGALRQAVSFYSSRFDSENGGLIGAPKFPSSLPIRFLFRYHRRAGDQAALRMAVLTLEKMADGGIHDQVGGGFHRYSTDARWLVPHFEKMLYDNALLALAYLDGFQSTGRPELAGVARAILRYVERDMTSSEGAFYSASDADSLDPAGRRREGWFFTWTAGEIEAALGSEAAPTIAAYYGVSQAGNFEGRNILHVAHPLSELARHHRSTPEELGAQIARANQQLYRQRALRPPPLRDEKIMTAWNGLMISACARAGLILGDEHHLEQGRRAAELLLGHFDHKRRLVRNDMQGRAENAAFLDDYAFLASGLIDLFEATGERKWLQAALDLDAVVAAHYEDPKGGFFLTSDDGERLLTREKPSYDGAEPSGNSVQVANLLRLGELTGKADYRARAERALRAFGDTLTRAPPALSVMLESLDFYLSTPKEIVIVAPSDRAEAGPLLEQLRRSYLPNRVLVITTEGRALESLRASVPLLEGKIARHGRATAYVCERRVCKLPTSDPAVFARQLQ